MPDQDLRKKLIRLAAENPELQDKLLPLLAAQDFGSMSMSELEKAVAKKIRGSKHNSKQMMLELPDGKLVMFSRRGRGAEARTEIDIWKWDDPSKRKTVPLKKGVAIKSVADAISRIKRASQNKTAEYVGEAQEFADMLKKKWRTVKYDAKRKTGTADIGTIGKIKFHESGSDSAVVVFTTEPLRLKGDPKDVMETLAKMGKTLSSL